MSFWSKLSNKNMPVAPVAAPSSSTNDLKVLAPIKTQGAAPEIAGNQKNIDGRAAASMSESLKKPATTLALDLSSYRDALNYGTLIKGKLSFEGSVRIDGKLDGEVVCSDNLLIGSRAEINASLSANNLVIQGTVSGVVKARGKVEVLSGAVVDGEIFSNDLVVEPGARINSHCRIQA